MTSSPGIVPHFKINTHIQIQRVWCGARRQDTQEYLKWGVNICSNGHDPYENQGEWKSKVWNGGWWYSIFFFSIFSFVMMMIGKQKFHQMIFSTKHISVLIIHIHIIKNRLCLWLMLQHKSIKLGLQKKSEIWNGSHNWR